MNQNIINLLSAAEVKKTCSDKGKFLHTKKIIWACILTVILCRKENFSHNWKKIQNGEN